MLTAINVDVCDSDFVPYEKPVLQFIKAINPQIVTFDFDNFSEPAIIDYAIDLLNQSSEIIVLINLSAEEKGKFLLKFMDSLTRQRSKKVYIFFNGEDALISKMLSVFPAEKVFRNLSASDRKEKIREILA